MPGSANTQEKLERRISRQRLIIEQVRLHLSALRIDTDDAVSGRRWLAQLESELAHLEASRLSPEDPCEGQG